MKSPRLTKLGLQIEQIMQNKVFEPLTTAGKLLLGAAGALAILVGIASSPQVEAQSQSAPAVAFEAASIKESRTTDPRSISMRFLPGGRVSATAIPLRWLIAQAYGVPIGSTRLSPGPEFDAAIGFGQYDIEAVAPKGVFPAGATAAVQTQSVRRMLQTLLAERFKLVVRRETKELPVYAIVIGKNGAKLKTADVQEKDCKDDLINPDGKPCHRFNGGRGRGLHGDAVTMTDLAQEVENWSDRPIVERTGLTRLYDIQTTGWRPQDPVQLQPRPDGAPPTAEQLAFADPSTPTMFDIFEQLGLKLETQKVPVETILLISIQRPTEN